MVLLMLSYPFQKYLHTVPQKHICLFLSQLQHVGSSQLYCDQLESLGHSPLGDF